METRAREAFESGGDLGKESGEEGRAKGKKENGSDKGEARAGLSDLREGGGGGGREGEKERDDDEGRESAGERGRREIMVLEMRREAGGIVARRGEWQLACAGVMDEG